MRIFYRVEKYASIALMGLMTVVIFSAVLELAYVIATDFLQAPGMFLGVEDLFDIFGLFLMVLIGLELMTSLVMYLETLSLHADLMLLIAITAFTRKVVILDAKAIDPMILFGVGFVILALTAGFFLMRRSGKQDDLKPSDYEE